MNSNQSKRLFLIRRGDEGWKELWALIASYALIVCAFLLVTLIVDMQERGIGSAAQHISQEAAPVINHLTNARSELRVITRLAETVERPDKELAPSEGKQISDANLRFQVERKWFSRGPARLEKEPPVPAMEAMLEFEAAVTALGAALDARSPDAAVLASVVLRQSPRIDDLLRQRIEQTGTSISAMASEIESLRVSSRRAALMLNVLITLFAVVGTGAMVRRVHRLNDSMRQRIAELDQFAVRMAHDVRGPLATPAMTLELLGGEPSLGAAQREMIDRARGSLTRAIQIIEGLLGFARSIGAVDVEKRGRSSLVQGISEVLEEYAPAAKAAGIRLDSEHIDDVAIACAPGVLASFLSNLTSNAIRYMGARDERMITFRSRARGDKVRIEVEDTGPGMAKENLENIFEPYVRGANVDVPGGLGLGLATVKRLAHAYGGDVGVQSVPGRGSLFWFELPIARAAR